MTPSKALVDAERGLSVSDIDKNYEQLRLRCKTRAVLKTQIFRKAIPFCQSVLVYAF
jgi:hypothetical protein